MTIVAISDTHFGDDTSLLDDKTVDRLMGALADRGPISELILLGDIVDLWLKTEMAALRAAKYFIYQLAELGNIERITYVPGNHDYDMFMNEFRLEVDTLVGGGVLVAPKFKLSLSYGLTVLGWLARPGAMEMSMEYPFALREVGGRKVVFTHGHHLDFFASSRGWTRTAWLARLIMRERKRVTLQGIEMANMPFYAEMSATAWVPEIVKDELSFYHGVDRIERLFRAKVSGRSPLRDTLIRENYREIERLLPLLECADADCFVFGHTHRPGTGWLPGGGPAVGNPGSWLKAADSRMPQRTWVEVGQTVDLYSLGCAGAELIDSASMD